MKKVLIITLLSLFLISGCNNKENQNENKKQYDAKIGEIQNLKETNKTIPDFVIDIKGIEDGSITKEDLNDIKVYDFDVDVTAYDLDPASDVYRENWTGVKVSDVLKKKGIEKFDSIDFKSTGNLTVRYNKEEINDKLYLVFYRNGEELKNTEDTPVMLFAVDLKNRFWVPSLTRMDII